MDKKSLTILVPVFNEEHNLLEFYSTTKACIPTSMLTEYTFLFVDDGSTDKSWEVISKLVADEVDVKGIRFARNFGKEAALRAGIENITSDGMITIDCDFQHPPQLLNAMITEWLGNKIMIVSANKLTRQTESFSTKIFAKTFYYLYRLFTGRNIEGSSDFKLLDRVAIEELKKMGERVFFFRGAVEWMGLPTKILHFHPQQRSAGQSGWGTLNLFKYAFHSLLSFSFRPLYFLIFLYLIYSLFALGLLILTLYRWLNSAIPEGFPTVYFLTITSVSLLMLGLVVLAGYIVVIYSETKGRQHYVILERSDK